ncbi:MAG: hypothetical protein QF893_00840 [Alphaproteobacteria bacterium]|jgi:hypothetical protein|nr:hypothetical protein [Alphaproteobacteria bacterium]
MGKALLIAVPLVGAILPIVVTQFSKDDELRKLGRAVVKYAVALPIILVAAVIGTISFVA